MYRTPLYMGKPVFWNRNSSDRTTILFYAEVSFSRLEFNRKKLIYCIARDVTERKPKKLSRTLAVCSLIGIYVLHIGRLQFVNRKFQEYVGYNAGELIGMNSMEIVHSYGNSSQNKGCSSNQDAA